MPIRLPKQLWEWILVFSPSVVTLPLAVIGSFAGDEGRDASPGFAAFAAATLGSYFTLPVCVVAGFAITQAPACWYVSVACFVLASLAVAALNFGIAFAGCLLVMHLVVR